MQSLLIDSISPQPVLSYWVRTNAPILFWKLYGPYRTGLPTLLHMIQLATCEGSPNISLPLPSFAFVNHSPPVDRFFLPRHCLYCPSHCLSGVHAGLWPSPALGPYPMALGLKSEYLTTSPMVRFSSMTSIALPRASEGLWTSTPPDLKPPNCCCRAAFSVYRGWPPARLIHGLLQAPKSFDFPTALTATNALKSELSLQLDESYPCQRSHSAFDGFPSSKSRSSHHLKSNKYFSKIQDHSRTALASSSRLLTSKTLGLKATLTHLYVAPVARAHLGKATVLGSRPSLLPTVGTTTLNQCSMHSAQCATQPDLLLNAQCSTSAKGLTVHFLF